MVAAHDLRRLVNIKPQTMTGLVQDEPGKLRTLQNHLHRIINIMRTHTGFGGCFSCFIGRLNRFIKRPVIITDLGNKERARDVC